MKRSGGEKREEILLVTYNYPPSNTAGVFRIMGFVNYFPKYGYQPIVLTVENPLSVDLGDPQLGEFIREKVILYKVRSLDVGFRVLNSLTILREKFMEKRKSDAPRAIGEDKAVSGNAKLRSLIGFIRQLLAFPDTRVGFVFSAAIKSFILIRKRNIKIVLTSSPPHSNQLIGLIAKKMFSRVKWIADYRDPWIDNPMRLKNSELLERIERKLEKLCISSCDLIVANTRFNKAKLLKAYPFLNESKICVITNGFDREDLKKIKPKKAYDALISCCHVGSTYPGMVLPLTEALAALKKRNPNANQKIHFNFVGYHDDDDEVLIQKRGLEDLVSFTGHVPYSVSLQYMLGADLLLYLMPESRDMAGWVPSKLFNYLAAEKPVLAVVPGGDAGEIVNGIGITDIFSPSDAEGIVKYLERVINGGWIKNQVIRAAANEYERERLVERPAKRIDKLLETSTAISSASGVRGVHVLGGQ